MFISCMICYSQGIMPRVYETFLVLFLVAILVCGIAWVASAIIDGDSSSRQALFGEWILLGNEMMMF